MGECALGNIIAYALRGAAGRTSVGAPYLHIVFTVSYGHNTVELHFEIILAYSLKNKNKYISFTLYPAHRRVGRGNLVLTYSVPHFTPNSEGIAC